MADLTPAQLDESTPPAAAVASAPAGGRWRVRGWSGTATPLAVAVAMGGAIVVLQLALWRLPHGVGDALGMAVTALTAAALSVATFRRRTVWAGPTEKLAELLPKARAGEVPIDELAAVGGGLSPIVPLVQDLLRDLRAERARTNELNEQVRLRVAQRTDVLERRLGALYHQATLDPLTGLRNRRLMDKALPRLIGHARTCGNECGVLMLDVDHFKALNDARGHPVGDDFLRDLGQLIKSGLHAERDMAFRVGGDEFVITRSDTSPAACQSLAERLITLSEAMGKTYRLPAVPKLSVGWAVLSEAPEPTAGPLLALADKRLYQAKSSGSRIARAS